MAIYWMTEVLPMAITALLPIVLMPPLGVMGSVDLAKNYLKVSKTQTDLYICVHLVIGIFLLSWKINCRTQTCSFLEV